MAGAVATVFHPHERQPELFLDGWGCVRLEDVVLVTADGCSMLSRFDYALPWSRAQSRCKSGLQAGLQRFPARKAGDRLRPVSDASSISISTINRACGL